MSTVAEQNTQTPVQDEPQYFVSPGVNILENADAYVLVAELPGVAKDGVDIDVEGTTLTLTGKRAKADLNATPLYRESSRADYRRVFELDPAIDTGKIEAKIEQGVLTITLPKSERVKPRKVSVND
jgi:HSP20 family protein